MCRVYGGSGDYVEIEAPTIDNQTEKKRGDDMETVLEIVVGV